ncbi:uncharacterized protein [Drosophila virilis]|uniref:Chitin-binding type-4 domain-containing protein n=1 Tax=Drosophila virilis TaxID=7244 RepID=B4LXI3_DROVI|nr:uncharacterized protein LOC6631259 [Drosophila virilis]EDW66767.1 uncharacterized protein Dvir_GJ23782 [Drosophila virilis]
MKYHSITTTGVLICCLMVQIDGHGMMLSPVARSSRWRYDSSAPTNYDDNALYCGGFWKQTENDGQCGLCGDDYSLSAPRANELGGKYGAGVIVKSYNGASSIEVNVLITANHLGHFSFHLCSLDEHGSESEQCFDKYPLQFADGSRKYYISSKTGSFDVTLKLPSGVSCQHCVLRWTYTAGNNWGVCEDGSGAMGCGAQETFKNCADISIVASARGLLEASALAELPVPVEEVIA